MSALLSERGIAKKPLGKGGHDYENPYVPGRGRTIGPMRKFQASYIVHGIGSLAVAGRRGIVREVTCMEKVDICGGRGGMMLVVDVGFNVAICNALSIRVAVWDVWVQRDAEYVPRLKKLGRRLLQGGVRLVGGEFRDALGTVVRCFRQTFSVRVAVGEVYRAEQSAVAERVGDDVVDANRAGVGAT